MIFRTELAGLIFGKSWFHVIHVVKGSEDNGDGCELPCSLPALGFTCNFRIRSLSFNFIVDFFWGGGCLVFECFVIPEATAAGSLLIQFNSKFSCSSESPSCFYSNFYSNFLVVFTYY